MDGLNEDKGLIVVENPATPSPRGGRRKREPKLHTLRDVKMEMANLYRASRYRGEIDPGDAAKLAYILRSVAEVIAAVDIEERLELLEGAKP